MIDVSKDEFDKLVSLATAAAKAYYNTDEVLMSDFEYDTLLEQITQAKVLHPDWGDVKLEEVGAGVATGGDVVHSTPMLSLAKTKTKNDLFEVVKKINGQIIVEPKIDGMALEGVYVDGKLTIASTRGDSQSGDNVFENVKNVSGLPLTLSQKVNFIIRGEIYMNNDDFDGTNLNRVASGKNAFANPRNAVAGILHSLELKYVAHMSFAAYDISDVEGSYYEKMQFAKKCGVHLAMDLIKLKNPFTNDTKSISEAIDQIQAQRSSLGFPIDGAVVKADDYADRLRLGSRSSSPNWAAAFKYAPDTALTTLNNIEMDIGRTGLLSLRAVLEPVELAGSTIKYATLHNPKYIMDADLRLGDKVWVYKAGDIIPKVTAPALNLRKDGVTKWIPPDNCPKCQEKLVKEGLMWRCETPACSLGGKIQYFASRDVMDIEGLDVALAETLVNSGMVKSIADLYVLNKTMLTNLVIGTTVSGNAKYFSPLMADKLLTAIEKSKEQTLARAITSLGIRGVGRSMGRRLAVHFSTMDALRKASLVDLMSVEGISLKKGELLLQGLKDMSGTIDELGKLGVKAVESTYKQGIVPSGGVFAGKNVVITGGIAGLSRSKAQDVVEKLGGHASSSVSKATDIVVVGENAGSKADKAMQLGIKIMSAEEFLKLTKSNSGLGIS